MGSYFPIDELLPLKRFKDCSGRPTILLSLTQVYNSFNGVDEPEQIKKCIAHYENTQGVKSVLLVGDVDKFPVRWRWWGRWLPNDPRLKGDWKVVNGAYEQSNDLIGDPDPKRDFCSWVDIGPYDEYTIEVDCTPLSGSAAREVRVHFANADLAGARLRLDLLPTKSRLVLSQSDDEKNYTFSLNQTYHIKIELSLNNIKVWVGTTKLHDTAVGNYSQQGRGKIGLGTWQCACRFDNFKVTSKSGAPLWNEDFNDGKADGFTEAPTMNERGWAVSDLYYADLYKDGTKTFDDWNSNKDTNGHHEQLYGEIEWDASVAGYCAGCTINNDKIDFLPDVAVGRIPASNGVEVTRYVRKVIAYELGASPDDPWFKKAVTYQGEIGDKGTIDNIEACLKKKTFKVENRWWNDDLKNYSDVDRPKEVIKGFNAGAGFINYIGGHGSADCWGEIKFCGSGTSAGEITNSSMLPIVFSSACFNGRFSYLPPLDPYVDVYGNPHQGMLKCQRFPGPPDSPTYTSPKPIQVGNDAGCIAEDLLFKFGNPEGSAGAIAYLGVRSAGRHGHELAELFYESYNPTDTDPAKVISTLGEMWKYMIKEYYVNRNLKKYETTSYLVNQSGTFEHGHYFDEPQKFIVFGDPSLVVGGAFPIALGGVVYDSILNWGPLTADDGYRIETDVTVPAGERLTALPWARIRFDPGKKLKANDADPSKGFIVNATSQGPVCFLSKTTSPQAPEVYYGMKVTGQLRLRSGGEIKLY